MTKQPEAIRLADALDELDRQFSRNGLCGDAGHELRRLARVEEQRDELLEALKELLNAESSYPWSGWSESELAAIEKARAAIAKSEE